MAIVTCIPGTIAVSSIPNSTYTQMFRAPSLPLEHATWQIALKVVAYVVVMAMAIVGNSVVLLIVLLNKKMRTITNVLLLNLAFSDLMVGVFCMWIHMGNQISDTWQFGAFFCKFSTFSQVTLLTASVLSLTAISVERLTAVVFPFKHHWSPAVSAAIIGFTWLVSMATASPHLFVREVFVLRWKDKNDIYCAENWDYYYSDTNCNTWQPGKRFYYVAEGVVMYFIPITIMIGSYFMIAIKLNKRKAPGMATTTSITAQEKAKQKTTKMLAVVLVVFIICWTPQPIMLVYEQFYTPENTTSYRALRYVAVFVASTNSALNPILYGGCNKNFKDGFREAFRCILVKKRNKIVAETQTPGITINSRRHSKEQDTTQEIYPHMKQTTD